LIKFGALPLKAPPAFCVFYVYIKAKEAKFSEFISIDSEQREEISLQQPLETVSEIEFVGEFAIYKMGGEY
jgi:hypothetical protein